MSGAPRYVAAARFGASVAHFVGETALLTGRYVYQTYPQVLSSVGVAGVGLYASRAKRLKVIKDSSTARALTNLSSRRKAGPPRSEWTSKRKFGPRRNPAEGFKFVRKSTRAFNRGKRVQVRRSRKYAWPARRFRRRRRYAR